MQTWVACAQTSDPGGGGARSGARSGPRLAAHTVCHSTSTSITSSSSLRPQDIPMRYFTYKYLYPNPYLFKGSCFESTAIYETSTASTPTFPVRNVSSPGLSTFCASRCPPIQALSPGHGFKSTSLHIAAVTRNIVHGDDGNVLATFCRTKSFLGIGTYI